MPTRSTAGAVASDGQSALVLAAQHVFAAKGYTAAGTDEIAKSAGVSKSLVFRHFGSKAGLFASSVVQPLLALVNEIAAELDSPTWEESDLQQVTTWFVTNLYDRMCDVRPMLIALLSVTLREDESTGEVDFLNEQLQAMFDGATVEHLKTAERFGIVGYDPDLAVRITFGLVIAMTVLDGWLLETMPRRPSRRRVAAELSAFVHAAIQPRPAGPSEPTPSQAPTDLPTAPRSGRRAWGTAPRELLTAAATVFAEKGYAAASTKEIAKRASVAESLLFFHFPTKADLFAQAVFDPFLDTVETFTGDWDRTEWRSHPIEETIRDFIAKICDWAQAERPLLIGVVHSSILAEETGPEVARARERLRTLFDRIEVEHRKAHDYMNLSPRDIPLTIRATFAAVIALTVLDHWLLAGLDPAPPREKIRHELIGYLTAATLRE